MRVKGDAALLARGRDLVIFVPVVEDVAAFGQEGCDVGPLLVGAGDWLAQRVL